ncbi:MAG: SET domain-containing protein-lysine N-methyltransferase [Armatimonadetes bacterium]|nr:SET domain-containing protein-lysine N-methyltransferase [Armatimonadota bacterium]
MGTDDPAPVRRRVRVAGTPDDGWIAAAEPIRRGEAILRLTGAVRSEPTRHTVQIGDGRHLDPDGDPLERQPWRYLNHSCRPNAGLVGPDLVALRDIAADEQVTFNYNTTEVEMASPFACRCGAADCAGTIRGFRHLSRPEQERLRPLLPDHLLELLLRREASGADCAGV